jgi:glycosyltransferase involved in cell wall biosynthesis
VLVPTWQAARHLPGCLAALWAQTWDGPIEVVVADGGSTDGTRAVVEREIAAGRPVRLVDNPARIQAAGLNRAAQEARHDLLVRCDAQARFPPDAIRLLVEEHRRVPGANVGGRQLARAPGTTFGAAVAAVYNTSLGSGGAGYRRGTVPADVDTVYLGSWPRDRFLAIGGFDPGLRVNEDTELNIRWRRAGGRVRLLPQLAIDYVPRATPRALALQYARYGFWRARTTLLRRQIGARQLTALLPLLSVLAWVAAPHRRSWRVPALTYALAVGATGLAAPAPVRARPLAPVALAIMHLSWGAGFIVGLVRWGPTPCSRTVRHCGG